MPICISKLIKWSKFSSLGLCTSACSDLVMAKIYLKWQCSALGVCVFSILWWSISSHRLCTLFLLLQWGYWVWPCYLWLESLFCAVCKPEIKEDPWRACLWKRRAERKDVNCSGRLWGGYRLLVAGSKSWTSCQTAWKTIIWQSHWTVLIWTWPELRI